MATYKVIQDIEAEDKFVGPLTLKQFVFGMIGVFFLWLNFVAITRGFSFATIIFTPPMLLGVFMAIPWSKDQPTEVWVLAKLRYYFKPRRRIWDQSGMEELVTITAPKKEEKQLTDNLSQSEVKSRLTVLAQTIDSRGWAIKDAASQTGYRPAGNSDRLVAVSTLPQEVPPIDISSIPDVYADDTTESHNLDVMIQQSTEMRMNQNLEKMNRIRNGEALESIVTPPVHITPPATDLPPLVDEARLTEELKHRRAPSSLATAHMRTINPLGASQASTPVTSAAPSSQLPDPVAVPVPTAQTSTTDDQSNNSTVSQQQSAAILEYAGNNDLNIATIARQAKKDMDDDSGEVVISLR